MSHFINSRALTGEKPCINKAIHALLMHGTQLSICSYWGHRITAVTRCVLPCPRTGIVRANSVRNKIVQEIMRNVANVFSFYAIIAIEHGFSMHWHSPVPWKVLKTAAFDLGFQHLPRDLANVNAWKTMFDPYIDICQMSMQLGCLKCLHAETKESRVTNSYILLTGYNGDPEYFHVNLVTCHETWLHHYIWFRM